MSDAAWHPDPLGRFELRYWDGTRWTEHVATDGVQQVDPEPLGYDDDDAGDSSQDDAGAVVTSEEGTGAEADDRAGIDLDPAGQDWVEDPGPSGDEPQDEGRQQGEVADAGGDEPGAPADDGEVGAGASDELPGAAVLGVPEQRGADQSADAGAGSAGQSGPDVGPDGIGGGLLDDDAYAERSTERVVLQNPRMLKVRLGRDVMIKRGTMVAYQGQMSFNYESEGGGVTGLLKRAVASDNSKMARVSGSGDLFLADDAFEIHMLELAGGGLVVNGPNLLAFEDGMTFRTRSLGNAGMVAGGVFVTDVSGHGWVAVTCHGTPVRLDTDVPTHVDVGAAVAWSSSLHVDLNVQKLSVKGMRSGEIAQLAFRGEGFVLVQASEGPYVPAAT